MKIATDLLVGAFHDRHDRAYLVSSDTDLIPALQWAKDSGKEIAYVGFAHQPSYALLKAASSSRLLSAVELAPFISLTTRLPTHPLSVLHPCHIGALRLLHQRLSPLNPCRH